MAPEDQLNANLERIVTGLRSQLDGSLRKAAEEIVRALTAERDRAVAAATADVRRQAQEQLAQLRDAAKKQNEDVRSQAESQVAELRRMLEDLRKSTQQQIETARKTLESEVASARARAAADTDEARRAAQARVEELQRTTAERVAAMERELVQTRAELEEANAELNRANSELNRANSELSRANSELSRAKTELSRANQRGDVGEIVEAARALDEATSLHQVCQRLLDYARRGATRCGIALADGDRAAPVIGDPTGESAASMPLTVAGTVVAVLYVEASPAANPSWLASLDLVTRHASRVLETTTVQQAIGLPGQSRPGSVQ